MGELITEELDLSSMGQFFFGGDVKFPNTPVFVLIVFFQWP